MKAAIVVRIILTLLLFGIIIFVPYGSLYWPEAWILFGIFFIYMFLSLPWFLKNNPELIENRMTYTPTEGSDRLFTALAGFNFFIFFILIGLDAGQLKIAPVPDWGKLIGFMGISISLVFIFLTLRENTFASRIIEVQEDQQVISSGPYSLVRHPFYLGVILFTGSIPLALGSFLGYIPWIIFALLFVYRIKVEEAFLTKELKGYKEYRKKVPKRLIPLIW